MRKGMFALAAVGLLSVGSVAACGNDDSGSKTGSGGSTASAAGKVGIILPDTKSSQRWGTDDPKFLKAAFAAAGVDVDIQNAQGDKQQFQTIADGMISNKVKVLIIVNLDSGTGKAVLDKAKAAGIATIDYDRLTLNGGANYYVSFDNVKVGELQGQGLVDCLTANKAVKPIVAELNGSPTDNNATLFAQGYNSVLGKQTGWKKLADQSGNWDAAKAQTVFTTMLGQHPDINAVMVANDTMAQSVINVLKSQGLAGKVAVSGQDATAGGLDNIMAGTQCFTIYKPVAGEADVAIKLASQILDGQKPTAPATTKDPVTGRDVPSYLATPTVITKANVALPVTDGYVTADAVCPTAALVKLCAANGIQAK